MAEMQGREVRPRRVIESIAEIRGPEAWSRLAPERTAQIRDQEYGRVTTVKTAKQKTKRKEEREEGYEENISKIGGQNAKSQKLKGQI